MFNTLSLSHKLQMFSLGSKKEKKKEIIIVINAGVRLTCMNIANNLRTNAGMTMSLTIFTE